MSELGVSEVSDTDEGNKDSQERGGGPDIQVLTMKPGESSADYLLRVKEAVGGEVDLPEGVEVMAVVIKVPAKENLPRTASSILPRGSRGRLAMQGKTGS